MTSLRKPGECSLYGILDTTYLGPRDPAEVAVKMLEGGVDIIQVRAKGWQAGEVAALSKIVLLVTRPAGVPLIVNDHPAVAAEVGADGVHVGQEDGSVKEARRIAGGACWVGKSTHSLEQALAAQEEGADYIGVGPVFATPTKPDYKPVGLELVRKVAPQLHVPFFCIGGIKRENAADVLGAGAKRIVVVSGILQADNITDYCSGLRRLLDEK